MASVQPENRNDVFDEISIDYASSDAATIADLVHGTMRLHPFCEEVRFTPQVKRLDGLRQLGVAYSVFPSACHTRLAHSLGVSYLCLELVRGLRNRHQRGHSNLDLEKHDIRNVALAGLCHDLGHGPLSHAFEKEFLRRCGHEGWEHEDMSLRMFEHMLEENNIEGIDKADMTFIERLIKGVKPAERAKCESGKRFLFDIVSNDHNGIDMDRADYMQRDALNCGRMKLSCNFHDLMSYARVVDDQVCYPTWQINNIWKVYSERVRLFSDVYTHRCTKAAEVMTVDALLLADRVLHLSDKIHNPEDFMALTDQLVPMIETYDKLHWNSFNRLSGAEQRTLRSAQDLLKRLSRNDLYDCCGECEVPERMLMDGTWEKLRNEFRESLVAPKLKPCDVHLDENRIDYGKGGVDPMATVGFYQGDGDSVTTRTGGQSKLLGCKRPSCFKKRTVRLFVRNHEHRTVAAEGFREWCRQRLGSDGYKDPAAAAPSGGGGGGGGGGTSLSARRKRGADVLAEGMASDRPHHHCTSLASSPQTPPPTSKKCKVEPVMDTPSPA